MARRLRPLRRRGFLAGTAGLAAGAGLAAPGRAQEVLAAGGKNAPQLPFEADYSLIVGAGQSNLQGDQCAWLGASPTLYGNAMLGLGTRPIVSQLSNPGVDLFEPVGGSNTITPLVSVNQSNQDGSAVAINQGGFSGVTGAAFAYSPDSTLTLTAPTGTMVKLVNGTLVSTAVGGPGQPAFDLTQVFAAGMGVWVNGVTGGPAAENINTISTLRISEVTATQLTLTTAQGFGYDGTSGTPIDLFVTNNFGAFGEDPCVTQANDYAALAKKAGVLPAGKSFGVLNTAIAGQPIAALTPGASPDQYNRAIDGVTRFVAAAAALGKTAYVSIDLFEQGNGDIAGGIDTTQAAYTASLHEIYSGHRADYPGITGQTKPPVFLVSQTCGLDLSGSDPGNDAVVMAQLEFCTSGENPDAYCAGPTYYAPQQGVHETPNGQRWKGAMRAKIAYRILQLGQSWLPLYPTGAGYRNNKIVVAFHVPVGRLQFRPSYRYCNPTVFADAGFQATDSAGLNPVTAVRILNGTSVGLEFARSFVSPPRLQYADGANHGGIGNLYDSDPAVSSEVYEYVPFSGQVPTENIPAFTDTVLTGKTFPSPVGQPYALFNPCCVFNIGVPEDA